ncbi:glycosyltransferase family 2 protein [Candidatus Wolfebacteria bacterium]|nr:glycosyltransferase family 2 protein [Candidatus Wolfebacteria bacterium]
MESEYYYLKTAEADDLDNKKERLLYRIFEIFPGFLSLLTLGGVVFISWFAPTFAAIFIIIFDVYWLLKTIYLALHLRSAFKKLQKNLKIDWFNKLQATDCGPQADWKNIYHLILLPFYNESEETIKSSIESLKNSNYRKNRMIIVLAAEEKAGEKAKIIAEKIKKEYENEFFKFLITFHPQNIPGEISGKGSNITWAAKKAKEEIIDVFQIPYDKIIVSAFDIDTVVYRDYFARLTYVYLTTENPQNFSYQPVPFYINNIWEAPALARIVAFSATFWHTLQQERQERLTTFSSHSIPFEALNKTDFWQTNMVSEDSRIFWQLLLRHNGNYGVIPLHFPVKMDANVAPTFWQTMKNIYKQQRRWAWGCENIPYVLFGFYKNKKINFLKKLNLAFIYIEGFWSWATNALIIFMLGWLPIIIGGEIFRQTLLAYNLPQVTRWLMTLSTIGIVTSAYLTMIILPPKPIEYGKHRYLMMILQWPLLLATMIIFGAFPAIDAQTRLALGGKFRLGFWVTPKWNFKKNN